MQTINDKLVVRKNDYDILVSYLKGRFGKTLFDQQSAEAMQEELNKARVVGNEEFPQDVVGLNSRVRIKENGRDKILNLVVVTPDKADISKNRVSILAPIGVALIGFRQGDEISWKMPSGNKSFTIVEVVND